MRIVSIELDDTELPEGITVKMSRAEAVLIASYVGKLTPVTIDSSSIYDALVGSVFNRFWDDGLAEARDGAS